MKEFPKQESQDQELLNKAQLLMQARVEFRVQRNDKNYETGEVVPGKLQSGWKILNVKDRVATLYRESEIFEASLDEVKRLNPDQFNFDQETLQDIIQKKK